MSVSRPELFSKKQIANFGRLIEKDQLGLKTLVQHLLQDGILPIGRVTISILNLFEPPTRKIGVVQNWCVTVPNPPTEEGYRRR